MDAEFKNSEEFPCPEIDPEIDRPGPPRTSAVLLSDEIEYYSRAYKMIYPFNPEHLKPAGYRLSLGEDYSIGGKRNKLYAEPRKDELIIPPFEVAIISTKETVNLPRFIIARWNLRVSLVYAGLLWTGALQVDPGWLGPLYCPIYNLSNEEIKLRLGDQIVLMDFVKTTPFKKGISKEYPRPPVRKTLEDYNFRLKSALLTEVGQRIRKVEKETEKRHELVEQKLNRIDTITGVMFTVIGVLFAGLSILVTSATLTKSESLTAPYFHWTWFSTGLSIVAIVFASYLYFSRKEKQPKPNEIEEKDSKS